MADVLNSSVRFAQLLEEELKVRIIDGGQNAADQIVSAASGSDAVVAVVTACGAVIRGGVFVLLLECGQDVADLCNDLLHSGV